MVIKVLFFGATADETGTRSFDMTANEGATSEEVFDQVLMKFPRLATRRLLVAVNQEYVPGKHELSEGDEIAIFTAVSGG